MTTANDPNILRVSRRIRSTPERVFVAWTNPEAVKHWFGPGTCQVESAEIDLRVGGAYRIAVVSEEHGRLSVRGEYREITAPSKLVYTWQWEDDEDWTGFESIVTVEFVAVEGATDVRVTHAGFPNGDSRAGHEFGWKGGLEKLAARAEAIKEMGGPGRFSWNEPLVSDPARAAAFYTELMGWETAPMPGMPYTLFRKDGMEVGGMMSKPMPDAPSQWLAYLSVESVEKSAQRVVELGGKVIVPPHQIPDAGWIAVVLDPEGVSFGLFQRV